MKKSEIEKTKPTFIISVLKVEYQVVLVSSISNFFIDKMSLANDQRRKKNTYFSKFSFMTFSYYECNFKMNFKPLYPVTYRLLFDRRLTLKLPLSSLQFVSHSLYIQQNFTGFSSDLISNKVAILIKLFYVIRTQLCIQAYFITVGSCLFYKNISRYDSC